MVWYAGKAKATPEEKAYMARLKNLPCCVCLPEEQKTPTECHHITLGSRRIGNFFCLPLCREHHQKVHLLGIVLVKRLWRLVNETLGIQRSWPQSRIVSRR